MNRDDLLRLLNDALRLRFVAQRWRLTLYGLLGVAAGLGLLVIRMSEAASYLSDEAETCINCHIMSTSYITWQRSSHRAEVVCNECHVPHTSAVAKYGFKAYDGARHSTIFTLRREPQVLRATPAAQRVIQQNCVRCHQPQLQRAAMLVNSQRRCTDCHDSVPHGLVRSLAATQATPFPRLKPITTKPQRGDRMQ